MAWLMESGPGTERTHSLPEDKPYRIGRGDSNDLNLASPNISRSHAKIVPDLRGYLIRDVGSANGTFVNGSRIAEQYYLLRDGDQITLGNPPNVTLVFRLREESLPQDPPTSVPEADSVDGLVVDEPRRTVYLNGLPLGEELPAREFDILARLWSRRTQACAMPDLKRAGWPDLPEGELELIFNETIHTYIYRIRLYLQRNGVSPGILRNVRRVGYRLDLLPEESQGSEAPLAEN